MNIIFLDINGVLNSECFFIKRDRNMKYLKLIDTTKLNLDKEISLYLEYIDLDSLNVLFKIVNSTNSKIVVTSSWKQLPVYKNIKDCLLELGLPIIDETKEENLKNRGLGIKEYLSNHSEIDNYIIVDDKIFEDYDKDLMLHLIKTNLIDGLLEEDVDKSIKLLTKKL